MKFRLTYRGKLKARNSSTVFDKQEIRRSLHAQLKNLWQQRPLNEHEKLLDMTKIGLEGEINLLQKIGTFCFAPLVSSVHGWDTTAELEILILRPSEPGNLINLGGDLDNRLKTLFDALRIPKLSELPEKDSPLPNESPFFVLLQDDSLVTSFSVISDRLLTPTNHSSEVELIIHVRIHTTRSSWANTGISG